MIELRVLGSPDVKDPARGEAHRVLSAPKRFALLAYLAVAHPRECCPRDELLALFWPEDEADRARTTLRQTLRLLRRTLGFRALESRGDGIRLAPGSFWCDASAFEEALDAGRPEEAAALYRGPLLQGFHFRDAGAGFERWREREAARLQHRAARALRGLAEGAEGAADDAAAEGWWRRLLEIHPDDEEALRRLLSSLAARGNRARAERVYRGFERRLAAELEVGPSPETVELMREIRSRPERIASGGSGGGDAEGPAEQARSDPPPAARDRGPTPPPPRLRRRVGVRVRIGAAALLVFVLAAGWAGWRMAAQPGGARGEEHRLAVPPFTYRGADSFSYLGPGIADLLSTALDGTGGLRSVRRLATDDVEGAESTGSDVAAASPAGLEADLRVVGEVVEAGGRLRVTAALQRPGEGRALARASAEGPVREVFGLVDRLGADLLAGWSGARGGRLGRAAAVTTGSLPALKEFLRAEEDLRAGRYGAAIEALERATAHDTAFALAHYRLAVAAEWAPRPDLMRDAIEAAARHAGRLPARERSLVEASLARRRGSADEAEALYRDVLRRYPDEVEAWFGLGEVLFHHNPLRGRTVGESRHAWERVLDAEPGHRAALLHLARALAAELPPSELIRQVPPVRPTEGTSDRRALQIAALQALTRDDLPAALRAAELIVRESDASWVDLWYVVSFTRNLRGASLMLEPLLEPDRPDRLRAIGHGMRAHVEAGRGRWRSAREELALASALDPAVGLPHRALLAVLPFSPSTPAELRELRRALLRWNPRSAPPSPDPRPAFTVHDDVLPQLRAYLLGAVAARLGERAEVDRRRAVLESVREPSDGRELAEDLARGLAGMEALHGGRPGEALLHLETVRARTTFERAFLSPFHARALERHLRGEALFRLGRWQEALAWFESAGQLSPYELVYLAPSHLRRAQIHEHLGDPAAARRHYRRFLELWDDPDPEVEQLCRLARRRIPALGGEP